MRIAACTNNMFPYQKSRAFVEFLSLPFVDKKWPIYATKMTFCLAHVFHIQLHSQFWQGLVQQRNCFLFLLLSKEDLDSYDASSLLSLLSHPLYFSVSLIRGMRAEICSYGPLLLLSFSNLASLCCNFDGGRMRKKASSLPPLPLRGNAEM